jgi:hypothetical protein
MSGHVKKKFSYPSHLSLLVRQKRFTPRERNFFAVLPCRNATHLFPDWDEKMHVISELVGIGY